MIYVWQAQLNRFERLRGKDHLEHLFLSVGLLDAYDLRSECAEALTIAPGVLERFRRRFGPRHFYSLIMEYTILRLQAEICQVPEEAGPMWEGVVAFGKQHIGPDHYITHVSRLRLCHYYVEADPAKAGSLLSESLYPLRNQLGDGHILTILITYQWALAAANRGERNEVIPILEACVSGLGAFYGPEDSVTMRAVYQLGNNYHWLDRYAEATPHLEKCAEYFPEDATLLTELADCYHKAGRWREANDTHVKLFALLDTRGEDEQLDQETAIVTLDQWAKELVHRDLYREAVNPALRLVSPH